MSKIPLTATKTGPDKFGLRALLQSYIDDQWTADHYSDEQRCGILLEQFKRAVCCEMELLQVTARDQAL